MLQRRDSGEQFAVPVQQHAPPPVEESLNFWHPNRFGVTFAPSDFRKKLRTLHEDLEVTWHPTRHRWIVWYRRPRISHPLSPGWLLLLVVETSTNDYVPLDDRTLAAVYEQSGFKWGSGKQYWARIEEEAQREHEVRDKDRDNLLDDVGSDQWDHTKIQISMRGPSSGSKFVNHHAGD